MKIHKHGSGILLTLLIGCTTIAEHQATADRHDKPTGTVTRSFTAYFLPAADVHAICGGSVACERSGDIFMQQRGNWQNTEHTITWNFAGNWPEMDGNTITSPAWPSDELLGELLAENLGLPPNDYEYHRLFAHELMHGFGSWHD